MKLSNRGLRIELQVVAIKGRFASHHLHNWCIYVSLISISIIVYSISVDKCRVLFDYDTTEELHSIVGVLERRVALNNRTIVVEVHIANKSCDIISAIDHLVSVIINQCTLRRIFVCGFICSRTRVLFNTLRNNGIARTIDTIPNVYRDIAYKH